MYSDNSASPTDIGLAGDTVLGEITYKRTNAVNWTTNNYNLTLKDDFPVPAIGLTWTKGTGTITLSGGGSSVDFNGETIEDVVIDMDAQDDIVELTGTFVTDSLTCTQGTLDVNGQDITVGTDGMTVAAGCTVLE